MMYALKQQKQRVQSQCVQYIVLNLNTCRDYKHNVGVTQNIQYV